MSKLRILLADDHTMLREGLSVLLNDQPDMEVVAQASTGRQAIELVRECGPDIVVLDVSIPDMAGMEATHHIAARCPATRVIALSRNADPTCVRRAFRAGAAGFVPKRSAAEALIAAIRSVARGDCYVEPELAVELFSLSDSQDASDLGRLKLSYREEEVLRSIAWGLSNKEIAAELGLSIKTVESYKASALDKLKLRSRADIVRYAVSIGWLNPERVQG